MAQRVKRMIRVTLDFLDLRRNVWQLVREMRPTAFMPYLTQVFKEQMDLDLPTLPMYTKWIKARNWHHNMVLELEQLNLCPHLALAEHPKDNVHPSNEDTLVSHPQDYTATCQWMEDLLQQLANVQRNLQTSLNICGASQDEIEPLALPKPLQVDLRGGSGDASTTKPLQPVHDTGSKRHKGSASGDPDHPGRSLNPFPLQCDAKRCQLVRVLLDVAGGLPYPTCPELVENFQIRYRNLSDAECTTMANRIMVTINEYHLMCAVQDPTVVSPVIPDEILGLFPY